MTTATCALIANPAAGGGRTARLLGALRDRLPGSLGEATTLACTTRPGEGRDLARQALARGARHLVVVGGDGTIHEVVNGIHDAGAGLAEEVVLSIISTGTGCGLALSLGIPADLDAQLAIAGGAHARRIDLGRVTLEGPGPSAWFVNECQVGLGAEVVRRTSGSRKARGGSLAYFLTTAQLLLRYPTCRVEVLLGDGTRHAMPVTGIAIGNGAMTAGGMRLTPRAAMDDGLLDLLVIRSPTILRRVIDLARVPSGRHVTSPGCDYLQAPCAALSSSAEIPVSADGELIGSLPARFECRPRTLRVHCPPVH